jgi:hypothetical protein
MLTKAIDNLENGKGGIGDGLCHESAWTPLSAGDLRED